MPADRRNHRLIPRRPHRFLVKFLAAVIMPSCLLLSCVTTPIVDKKIVVSVLGEDSSNIKALRELKGEYEAGHGVSLEFNAHDYKEAEEKANQDFANGTGIYDVVLQYNFSLANFVRNNYVYTIEELSKNVANEPGKEFQSGLFQNAWQEVGYYYVDPKDPSKGTTAIGYPFAANTMVLVINREMFEDEKHKAAYKQQYKEELAPPTTWNQFEQIAAYFTPKDKSTYGVCLQGGKDDWLYYEWLNFLYGAGGAVMTKTRGWEGDETTPITIDSQQAIDATKLYLRT